MKANYTYLSDGTKTLESVAFGGGRIRKTGTSSYAVDYHITDHLGSVRAIVNAAGAIQEQNDYYPFGTRHPNGLTQLPANRWRFSGKEVQDAFGIAYSDFGARLYDRSASWTAIDPLAEKYYAVSPYAYCHDNPIVRVDPNGMIDWELIKKGGVGLGSGVGSALLGAAVIGGTGGGASPIGAVFVVDGVVGILLGTTYILTGLLTSPSEENDRLIEMGPSDVTNTFAKGGDILMNNQHHELEITTDIIKIGVGEGIAVGKNARIIRQLPEVKKAFIKLGSGVQLFNTVHSVTDELLPEIKTPTD